MLFSELAEIFERIENAGSKIEKTQLLAEALRNTKNKEEREVLIHLAWGKIYAPYIMKELGVSSNLMIKAIAKAYGISEQQVEERWKKQGDLGKVAGELTKERRQTSLLITALKAVEVLNALRKIGEMEGQGSIDRKITYLSSLLMRAEEREAIYICRIVLGEMRIGVAEGIIRDAIYVAYFTQVFWESLLIQTYNNKKRMEMLFSFFKGKRIGVSKEVDNSKVDVGFMKSIAEVSLVEENKLEEGLEVIEREGKGEYDVIILKSPDLASRVRDRLIKDIEQAYSLINDFVEISEIAREKGIRGLREVKPLLFRPIRVMLAQKVGSVKEALEEMKGKAAMEYKYDGFRTQIHKKDKEIKVFTRRMEDITKQFPDIVEYVRENIKAKECIIEGETIAYDPDTHEWKPFQFLSRRIKRKYDIVKMIKEIPVMTNLFDIIFLEGRKTIELPFKERRKILEEIVKEEYNKIVLAKQIVTDKVEEGERFYKEALEKRNEGIMVKNLNAPYQPGLRVGHMLKIKPTLESLDLTIVGAEWGEGKRKGVLSSFELACLDPDTGEYLTIGKMGTGIKEKGGGVTFEELTEKLKPYIIEEKGKEVKIKPHIVVEVAYEEIQKSPNYSSGFALRFPRLVRIREDRDVGDIDTIYRVEEIFKTQRHR